MVIGVSSAIDSSTGLASPCDNRIALTTSDARELSGIVIKETDTEVVLRDAAGRELSVAKKNITKRTSLGSLMPAGLVDALLPEERLDLIKFLSMLGKPGDFDAARGGVARAWKLYLVVSKNQHLGVERVVKGDFTLEDWSPAFSLVSGALPGGVVEAAFPSRGNSRGLFAATQFESPKSGPVRFTLTGEAKSAWVNGKLIKPGAQFTADAKAGVNSIVLQLDDARIPDAIKLTSGDVSFVTKD